MDVKSENNAGAVVEIYKSDDQLTRTNMLIYK